MEGDQALATAHLERFAAPDAAGYPNRTIVHLAVAEQLSDLHAGRPGQSPRQAALGAGPAQQEDRDHGEHDAGRDHGRKCGAQGHSSVIRCFGEVRDATS